MFHSEGNNVVQIFYNHTNGRVLNEEIYTHRFQKLNFLHSFTERFHKDISYTLSGERGGIVSCPESVFI